MAEFYKLLFDTALYYTLTGFYLMLAIGTPPEPAGFLALAALILADALLRRRAAPPVAVRIALLLLPFSAAFARPGFWTVIQLIPVWAYIGWSTLGDRIFIIYSDFKSHFVFGLKLLLLLLPGLLFSGRAAAVTAAVPYLTLMLACGICLLRMLREKSPSGVRQGIYIGMFVLFCTGLTVGKAPQLFMKAVTHIYQHVLAPLVIGLAMLAAILIYAIFEVLQWFVSLLHGEPQEMELEIQSFAETLGLEDEYEAYTADLVWLRTLLIVLAALTAALILFLIFRRLMGNSRKAAADSPYLERREKLSDPQGHTRALGRIRPRDPRLAVRYYYAKFLAECRKRGRVPPPGMTSAELASFSADVFPGSDLRSLPALYAPARYSRLTPVTAADADRAADAWRELKRSKVPEQSHGKKG